MRPLTAQTMRKSDKLHQFHNRAKEYEKRDSQWYLEQLHRTIEAKMERAKERKYEKLNDIQIRLGGDLTMKE